MTALAESATALAPPSSGPTAVLGRRRYSASGMTSALVVFVVLALVLPLYAISGYDRVGSYLNIGLTWAVVVYASLLLAWLCLRGGGSIVRLGYAVFIYCFMGLSVLAQIWSNKFPLHIPGTGAYTDGEVRRALFAVFVSIAAFEAAHLTRRLRGRGARAARAGAVIPTRRWYVDERRAVWLGVLGLAFAAVLIARTGLSPYFTSRQATGNAVFGNASDAVIYSGANKASGAVIARLAQGPCLVALFALLYIRHHKLPMRTSVGAATFRNSVLVALVVVNLIINNPIANSRFWFGTVAIAIASIYVPLKKAAAIRWVTVLTIAVLLFGFTSLQAFRYNGGAKNYSTGFQSDLTGSGTYSEFTMEMVGLRYLRVEPHTLGAQLVGSVFVFVPRSIWATKPIDTGNLVLPIANPAAPLWTEGDVEAGPWGVAIYFGLLGYAVAALDLRFRRARPGQFAHAVVPIAGGFIIFVLRGSLLSVFGAGYMLLFGVLAIGARRVVVPAARTAEAAPAAMPLAAPKRRPGPQEIELPGRATRPRRAAA